MFHTPAHKHVGDAGKPGQIVNRIDAQHTARDLMYKHGTATGRFTSTTSNMEEVQRVHGQIVNAPTPGRMVSGTLSIQQLPRSPEVARVLRDLMYKHGISPFNPAQKQAKTLKDTL